jgi:hypothetical protein
MIRPGCRECKKDGTVGLRNKRISELIRLESGDHSKRNKKGQSRRRSKRKRKRGGQGRGGERNKQIRGVWSFRQGK